MATSGPPAPRPTPPRPTVLDPLHRRFARLMVRLGFAAPGRWFYLLCLGVLVDVVVLSFIQDRAFLVFDTFSQDLGVYTQAFYTTTHTGQFFYYTSNIPAGTNGHLFAVHFAPLLILLVPIPALFPGPPTLLAMKVAALALAAFPVYGLTHRQLGSERWALAIGILYLVSPITMTLDWISFDPEVFLPVTFLASFYFLVRRRTVGFLVFWILSLMAIETAAPLLAVFSLVGLLGTFLGPRVTTSPWIRHDRFVLAAAFGIAVVWEGIAYVALRLESPVGATFGEAYARHFQILGATSLPGVLPQALVHPDLAGAALTYDAVAKLVYIGLLLAAAGVVVLVGPLRYSLPIATWLAIASLSNTPSYYSFGAQYLGYVSPFLFAGSIAGLVYVRAELARSAARLRSITPAPPSRPTPRRWPRPDRRAALPIGFALCVVAAALVANPFLENPAAPLSYLTYGFPTETSHSRLLHRILDLVPAKASILTTAHVFPEVADRANAYVLPTAGFFAGSLTYWGSLNAFINSSQFVLLDYTLDQYVAVLIQNYGNLTGFGALAAGDGIFLYERGWSLPPALVVPGSQNFSGASVAVSPTELLTAEHSSFGQALVFSASVLGGAGGKAVIWRGPDLRTPPPGIYNVTVYYKYLEQNPNITHPFSIRTTLTALNVTALQVLNTSGGHHYNFVFQRSPVPTNLSVQLVTVPPGGTNLYVSASSSITVVWRSIGSLSTVGASLSPDLLLYVYGISLTWLAPLPP